MVQRRGSAETYRDEKPLGIYNKLDCLDVGAVVEGLDGLGLGVLARQAATWSVLCMDRKRNGISPDGPKKRMDIPLL